MKFLFAAAVSVSLAFAAELQPLEFPAVDSVKRIEGELESADFIHRSGRFRTNGGELVDFSLMPFASILFQNAEADLRDIPLGTNFGFHLLADGKGRLAAMKDKATLDGTAATDAAEQRRKKFVEFNKKNGVPGWIDKSDGNQIVVTFFSGDPENFSKSYMKDIVAGKNVSVAVANDELRTWNPPTDKESALVLEIQKAPLDCWGCSGVRVVLKVSNMLEGFRRGRIVRVFGAGWPIKDQPFGVSLMGYGYGRLLDSETVENTAKEYPALFPFRTDYGNETLPWFKLKPGEAPPPFSEHVVHGELLKVDAKARTGQLRIERQTGMAAPPMGEALDFSVIPEGAIKHLGADATLDEIPAGTRCRLHLYQDEKGAFTQASLVSDQFSHMAANAVTYRLETIRPGKLLVARQLPEVKNYNGDMEKPGDIGRSTLRVDANTKVWKGDSAIKLGGLAHGDSLLVNRTVESPEKPSRCTDIWVGVETHKQVIEAQRKKHALPGKKP